MIVLYCVSLFFIIIYSGLIFFYRQGWLAIPEFFIPAGTINNTTISVIIPARNEEGFIGKCLLSVLGQTYPPHLFEVIVVDDHSTDATASIINSFSHKKVRLISLKDFTGGHQLNSYKKKAIDIAIQQSSATLIVTTDADC